MEISIASTAPCRSPEPRRSGGGTAGLAPDCATYSHARSARHGESLLQHHFSRASSGDLENRSRFQQLPVWVNGAGESRIEDGRSGDAVGAVRHVVYRGRHIRQRLLALSDVERSLAYEFCGEPSLPVTAFKATLRVTPVIDGDRAFVEWWADFDCEPARRDELAGTLRGWFAEWLESLRTALGAGTGHEPVSEPELMPVTT